MTEIHEVLDGGARTPGVIDAHRRRDIARGPEEHDRDRHVRQDVDALVGERQIHGDDPVDPSAEGLALDESGPGRGIAHAVQEQVVAARRQDRLDAPQGLAERPAGQERHDYGDGPRLAARQSDGVR